MIKLKIVVQYKSDNFYNNQTNAMIEMVLVEEEMHLFIHQNYTIIDTFIKDYCFAINSVICKFGLNNDGMVHVLHG